MIKTDFGGHTKHFVNNAILFPYNPGWAYGGVTAPMSDGTNKFSGNTVVGVLHAYNCGNESMTCRGPDPSVKAHNYSCVCPTGGTPHFTPPGNSTDCATVADNKYYFPPLPNSSVRGTQPVCPAASKIEARSMVHYQMPTSAELIQMAKQALQMPLN